MQTPLTLVSAPAGYGKSTLVSHWLELSETPCAWLSLDDTDSDLVVFVSYVVAAVESVYPGACPETTALIMAPRLPGISVLAGYLTNEFDDINASFVFVLDDYHRIAPQSEVHDLLSYLLEHPPRLSRLVIVTRRDPPIQLASMRGSGGVTEVRLEDLRFTASEIADFLQRSSGVRASDEAVLNLQQQTEGWAVALRLVALHLRHLEDPEGFLGALRGGLQNIEDYLLQQVWSRRSPQMQKWLVQTSILERFCADLCDAVCAPDDGSGSTDLDGRQFVEALQRTNLFAVNLDAHGEWFRYHHLFQGMLEEQLTLRSSADEIAGLHARASQWHEKHGDIEESIRHALAAGDVSTAAQIIKSQRGPAFNEDRWISVRDWLAMMPEEAIGQHTGLLLARAWVFFAKSQYASIQGILEQLELCPDEIEEGEAGEIALFEAIVLFYSGEAKRCVERSEDALALIPRSNICFRSEAEIFRGMGLQMNGQGDRAIRILEDSLQSREYGNPVPKSRLIVCQVYLHLLSARLPEARAASARLSRIPGVKVYVSCWAWTMRGLVHWFGNDLEKAVSQFSPAADRRHLFGGTPAIDAMVGLALSYAGLRKDAEATEVMDRTLEFAEETNDPANLMVARSGQARLALHQGDLESAKAWLRSAVHPPPDLSMLFWLEVPSLTRCRVLVADSSPSALEQALEQIDGHLTVANNTNNTCRTIEALVLKLTALEKLGRGDEVLAVWEEAVALAEPGNFLRPFVEQGRTVAGLLDRLHEKNAASPFIDHIASEIAKARRAPTDSTGPRHQGSSVLDALTNRELDVLELLAKRLQNKEIAARLCISTQTVGSHLKRIYEKLDVHGRRQAVQRAIETGILDHRPSG
jgi:ATP/maltotriose-dependent transcriptional regulator MalT